MVPTLLIRRILGALLFTALLAWPAAAQQNQSNQSQSPRDQLIRQIADLIYSNNAAVSTDALTGLRQLRDPRLRPIFVQLSADQSVDRVFSALLGMAELETPPRVDVVRMAELPSANTRAGAVGMTLRLGYLDPDGLARVVNWPQLDNSLEALLIAELIGTGRPAPPSRLAELARSEETLARTLALLLQDNLSAEAQQELADSLLNDLKGRERFMERVLNPILLALRSAKLPSTTPFVTRLGERITNELALEQEIILTLAAIAPDAARQRWMTSFTQTSSTARKFSLGLAALLAEGKLSETVDRALIESNDPTLAAMGKASSAIREANATAARQATVDALIALLDTRYDQATGWVIQAGSNLETPWRIHFAQQLLRWGSRASEQSTRAAVLANEGSRLLARDDAKALRQELDRLVEQGEEPMIRAVLFGIIGATERQRIWSLNDEPNWRSPSLAATADICSGLFDLRDQLAADAAINPDRPWQATGPQAEALTARLIDAATSTILASAAMRTQAAWLALIRLEPGSEAATRLQHQLRR